MKSSIMQFVLFWWQKVSERHPVDNSGITPQKMSRQTGGIFFRKYLVPMTSSRYKQVLNERCQLVMWALSYDISTYFRVWDSLYLPSAQQPPCRYEKRIQKYKHAKIQKCKNTKIQKWKKYNPLSNHLVDIPGGAFGPSVHAGNKRLKLTLSG